MGYVHDAIAHVEERFLTQGLGEEVGHVIDSGHERNTEPAFLHTFAHKVVSTGDVFRT